MHMHTKSTHMHNDGNVKSRGPNVKRLKNNTVVTFLSTELWRTAVRRRRIAISE